MMLNRGGLHIEGLAKYGHVRKFNATTSRTDSAADKALMNMTNATTQAR